MENRGFTKEELFKIEVEEALYSSKNDAHFRAMVEALVMNYNLNTKRRSILNLPLR